MSKITSVKNIIQVCIVFFLSALQIAHASSLVSVNQSGNDIVWQVGSNGFIIDKVNLTISGSNQSSANINGCTSSPLLCFYTFNGASPTFDTSGLGSGIYSWQIEITPLIDDLACSSPADVRDSQQGYQGLTSDSGGPTFEEEYLLCLLNAGLLPPDEQDLFASGSFTVASSGLIVPIDDNPVVTDNIPPIAICSDVVVEGSGSNCSITASIDNGSYDPDGTLVSIIQDPVGPYGLGSTNVILNVTDNSGDTAGCGAVVTVTDALAPTIQCPANNTMTPPTAPATFTATASDSCSVPIIQVVSKDCYRFNPNGRRIDTNDSCVVTLGKDNITVNETSGVNSFIDWTIVATDSSGNSADLVCTVEVLHPNSN